MKLLLLLLIVSFVAGCSSLSVDECVNDWRAWGQEDGRRGRDSQIHVYAEKCAKHEIGPDRAAYEKGYQAGLARYCDPRSAFQLGLQGDDLNDLCPASITPTLRARNASGLRIHRAEQRVSSLDHDIERNEKRQAEIADDITEEATSKKPSSWKIRSLRDDLSGLRRKAISLRSERARAERELQRVTLQESVAE